MQSVQKFFSLFRPNSNASSSNNTACVQCGGCGGFSSHFWDQDLCGNCKHSIGNHYWMPRPRNTEENTYNVILYNDDFHTFDMVISAIRGAIRCDSEKAGEIADAAHLNGGGIVYSGPLDNCQKVVQKLKNRGLLVDIETPVNIVRDEEEDYCASTGEKVVILAFDPKRKGSWGDVINKIMLAICCPKEKAKYIANGVPSSIYRGSLDKCLLVQRILSPYNATIYDEHHCPLSLFDQSLLTIAKNFHVYSKTRFMEVSGMPTDIVEKLVHCMYRLGVLDLNTLVRFLREAGVAELDFSCDLLDASVSSIDAENQRKFLSLLDSEWCSEIGCSPFVRMLNISNCNITLQDVKLLSGLKQLVFLDLSHNVILDARILELLRGLEKLEFLSLQGLSQLDDSCLPELAAMKSLKYLNICGCSITDEGKAQLQNNMPNVKIELGASSRKKGHRRNELTIHQKVFNRARAHLPNKRDISDAEFSAALLKTLQHWELDQLLAAVQNEPEYAEDDIILNDGEDDDEEEGDEDEGGDDAEGGSDDDDDGDDDDADNEEEENQHVAAQANIWQE